MLYNYLTYMARMESNETVLSLAVSKSNSLRTTVPIHITKKLGLSKGDRLDWDLDKDGDTWFVKITKKVIDMP